MSSSSLPPEGLPDKRTFQRYTLWFPITLVPQTDAPGEVWAICRDASAGGILVSSAALVPVGTMIEARFRVAPHGVEERIVEAAVVRCEANDGELMLAFPFRLALRFTTPIPELPKELTAQLGGDVS